MTTSFKARNIFLAALCGAAVLVGCGDNGDGDGTGSLTKEEFLSQGNAICNKAVKAEVSALEAAKQPHNKADEEALITDVLLPHIVRMTDDLASLGEPENGKAQAERVVGSFEDAIAKVEADPALALSTIDPFAGAKARAEEFGLMTCAQI